MVRALMSYLNTARVEYADSGAIDAFGRLRVATPYTLFESKQLYDKDTGKVIWDEVISGGTSVWSDSAVNMSVTTNNQYVIRQTKMRFNYQPGKSILCIFTGVMNTEAGVVKRIGYFNSGITPPYTPLNGYYFENNGTAAYVVINRNGTPNAIAQADWNIDKMDGNGPSGITINWAKAQILAVDFEWLGVGRVRFGIVVNGLLYYIHEFLHSNNIESVYTLSPNNPVRYEIRSTGGAGTLVHICATVKSEGGIDPVGFTSGASNGITGISTSSPVILVAVRLKSTHLDKIFSILSGSVLTTTANSNARWFLSINPTYNGVLTFNSLNDKSGVEVAIGTSANTLLTNGLVLHDGYLSSQARGDTATLASLLRAGAAIDGTRDIIALCAQSLSGVMNFLGALNWAELL